MRKSREGLWSWRSGGRGSAPGAVVVAGEQREMVYAAGWKLSGDYEKKPKKKKKAQNHSCPQQRVLCAFFLFLSRTVFTY